MSAPKYALLIPVLLTISLISCGNVTEYRYLNEVTSRGAHDIYAYEGGSARLRRGRELDRVWSRPNFNIGKYYRIYISPMKIDPALVGEERAARLTGYFSKSLQEAIRRRLLLQVAASGEKPFPENTLILETALTQLDRSGRVKNWGALLVGIYPLDPTHVQVEGRIKDAATGETLFLFADNRAGGPLFSQDEDTWRRHIADIAGDLVLELAAVKIKEVH